MNAPSPAHAENPYIGPYAFRVGDKLYGRDREANDLCNLLVAERIVLLLSPSGAGKTSLIQAELIPRLTNRGFHVWRPVRVRGPAAGTAMASDGTLRPNAFVQNALLSLEEELAPGERTDPADLIGVELKTYLDLRSAATATETHVLVFDQFEEILTVDPANEDDRRAFFAQVGAALRDQDRLALFALREEYWAGLEPYQDLIPGRLTTTYRLRLLDVQSATAAIANPAAAVGLPFASAAVDQLVGDLRTVRSARGGPAEVHRFVEPVQLQVVGRQLWEKLPAGISQIEPEHVAKYANVDTALENYYAEQVAAVALMYKCNVRSIRRWFDDSLISARGTRGQVRLGPEGSEGLPVAVVESLVNAYLVRKVERGEETWVELAHDRLVEPVRKNNKAWFQANLDVRERARILWEVAGGRLQVAIGVLLLVVAGIAIYLALDAIDKRRIAETDRNQARSIQLAVQAGDLRESQPDLALLLGAEAEKVADT
ncbi:MAG TPA: hypothetical protein VKB09_12880, partial [Thermomicrobiales bacterium]|nr:hypothetical protein [Thermomicrobiales bacterium]